MAFADFQVNAAAVMTNQPSRLRYIPAQPSFSRLTGGGTIASIRAEGARITVTWGVDVALDDAYDELITDLGSSNAARLRWEDPNGNTFDVNVVAENIGQLFGPAQQYQPFTVTFFERPA